MVLILHPAITGSDGAHISYENRAVSNEAAPVSATDRKASSREQVVTGHTYRGAVNNCTDIRANHNNPDLEKHNRKWDTSSQKYPSDSALPHPSGAPRKLAKQLTALLEVAIAVIARSRRRQQDDRARAPQATGSSYSRRQVHRVDRPLG